MLLTSSFSFPWRIVFIKFLPFFSFSPLLFHFHDSLVDSSNPFKGQYNSLVSQSVRLLLSSPPPLWIALGTSDIMTSSN